MSSTGTVKWFNATKGYGFIQPDNGGADVFVHISAVEKAGLRTLNENEKVSYDLVTELGKSSACNLSIAYPPVWQKSPVFGKTGDFCCDFRLFG